MSTPQSAENESEYIGFQGEALALYRNARYEQVREEIAVVATNKALGGGIRRFHFTKAL
jgi:putative acetyltransferase